MAERSRRLGAGEQERGVVRGAAILVVTGIALACVYNFAGLRGQPAFGIPWIGQQREELANLEDIAPESAGEPEENPGSFVTDIDDPMADFRGSAASGTSGPTAADLPDIPDLGRPIQMQLPAVKKFFDAGGALIIDSRDREDYELGHIPRAVNLPYEDAIADPALLESVDSAGRPIITYCTGGTCETSLNLAHALVEAGHSKVLVFMGGWPAWESAGYPVEYGAGMASVGSR